MTEATITVLRSTDPQLCREILIVLEAREIRANLESDGDGWAIYVSTEDFAAAREEISSYEIENRQPVSPTPKMLWQPAAWAVVSFVLALWLTAGFAELSAGEWYLRGRVDSAAIANGQYYRWVTALFLHSDFEHILANTGFGAAVVYFCARYLGVGLALFTALLVGASGNAINTSLRVDLHVSLGASTSVFGILGLLGIFGWLARMQPQHRVFSRFGPIIAALALLAYTGAGGENTDVGAHVWGFASGMLFALPLWRLRNSFASTKAQRIFGALAIVISIGCWSLALSVIS